MKKSLSIILILTLFLVSNCISQVKETPPLTKINEGRTVFAITDKAANLNDVTSVKITVDNIQVHSSEQGWVNVLNEQRTYDLLQLRNENSQVLLADVVLKEGNYQQIRLNISKVMVTDAKGEQEAKLPSGNLKLIGLIEVKPNTTSTVLFDFILDESLHVTGSGKYILAPVIQLETKTDAQVEIKQGKVEIKGGNTKEKKKVGMDAQGNVDVNLNIPGNIEVSIDNKGIVKTVGSYDKPEKYCEQDSDCKCGKKINTEDCFYGNKNYVNASQQCPDFCTGIAGNLRIKCINNKCEQEALVSSGY